MGCIFHGDSLTCPGDGDGDGFDDLCELAKGDVNGDGCVDLHDIQIVIDHQFQFRILIGPAFHAADCNGPVGRCEGDGIIDVRDVIKMIRIIWALEECT